MHELEKKMSKYIFVVIILTTVAQIIGFFSRNWACVEKTPFAGKTTSFVEVTEVMNVTNCDMHGLFYKCTYQGCYRGVINDVVFFLAFLAFVLDLGLGGYITYRLMIDGDSTGYIWSNNKARKILPGFYIISQLLAAIGFFITIHNYGGLGWSAIVFSLPGTYILIIGAYYLIRHFCKK